ncbi:MAG: glutathione S-transferase family protein [Chthoniobacterales bacterium]|nr:glutathione S-transferase family protein [Chthoniobacterales bacterium]
MAERLRLISHKLCPYVQRAVIVATEKDIPFTRIDIDFANKPEWFLEISPTGKVPVLDVTDSDGSAHILFESAVIAEYLDEIAGVRLLPANPLRRARERAWTEYASATLGDIAKLYSAPTATAFGDAQSALKRRLASFGNEIAGPWFAGERFGLVDAAVGPALRYLDVFADRAGLNLLGEFPIVRSWAQRLSQRPSVKGAVGADYAEQLVAFVKAKNSFLAGLLDKHAIAA